MPPETSSSPPRPASRLRDTQRSRVHRWLHATRLLKKTSPDLPPSPSLHLEGLTKSFTGDRLVPRRSTSTGSLQEMGRTALLREMPVLIFFPSRNSRHQSRTAKKTKRRTRQIRPMGSSDLPPNATGANSTTLGAALKVTTRPNATMYRKDQPPTSSSRRPPWLPGRRKKRGGS